MSAIRFFFLPGIWLMRRLRLRSKLLVLAAAAAWPLTAVLLAGLGSIG